MALVVPLLALVVIASADGGERLATTAATNGTMHGDASSSAWSESLLLFLWCAASLAIIFGTRGWRPGSLDGPAWRPTIAVGLAAAVLIVLAGVLGEIGGSFLWPAALGGGTAIARSIGAAVLQVGACAVIVANRHSIFQRSHGHPSSAWWSVFGGAMGLLLAWPLVQLSMLVGAWITAIVTDAPPPELAHETLRQLRESEDLVLRVSKIALAVVAAPFVEEVLYRGVIQQMLRATGMGRSAAIMLVAALFAVMHLGDGAVSAASAGAALPALFLLGVLFGVLFERTGRLAAPVTAHALFNAANVAFLLWRPSPTLPAP